MPKKKSKLPPHAGKKEQLHYNAVLLEEIRSQMNAVIETVDLTRTELNVKIDGVEERLTNRIQVVEMVVKGNSAKLLEHDQKFEKIDQRFERVEKKLQEHDKRFEQIDMRFDRVEAKLGEHGQQLTQLNEKMDRVVEKVDRHDEEIAHLKSAVTQNSP